MPPLFRFALVALLLGPAAVGEPPDPDTFRVSVNVELVVLNATVRDHRGQFPPELRQTDFQVFEDGVRQEIRLFRHEDVPVTVGLVIDHSSSMHDKFPDVIASARTFAKLSNPEDRMFVTNFNEHVTAGTAGLTNRPDELEAAILRSPADGQTALYDAVFSALARLQSGGPEKKVLIVFSDGGDTASSRSLNDVLAAAAKSTALVYAIGIFDAGDPDRNPHVLHRLANATGGEAFFPSELSGAMGICETIARDIRSQYTLGYVSSNTAAHGARSIRVTAGKFGVRARTGYVR
jgi:VWFA-related protein